MGKTIDELRAELAEAYWEYVQAARACPAPSPRPLYGCLIDRRHLTERVQAAAEARDAAETALFAALDAADEAVPGAAGVVLL